MSESRHTPGPWRVDEPQLRLLDGRGRPIALLTSNAAPVRGMVVANAHLLAAAPAYALAWSMVPDEIQQRIFNALHKPDTGWVEDAIENAGGTG